MLHLAGKWCGHVPVECIASGPYLRDVCPGHSDSGSKREASDLSKITVLDSLMELLHPADDGVLIATPVSTRVNSVKNDDPECLTPQTTFALDAQ